jgi:hypothetical protein
VMIIVENRHAYCRIETFCLCFLEHYRLL